MVLRPKTGDWIIQKGEGALRVFLKHLPRHGEPEWTPLPAVAWKIPHAKAERIKNALQPGMDVSLEIIELEKPF